MHADGTFGEVGEQAFAQIRHGLASSLLAHPLRGGDLSIGEASHPSVEDLASPLCTRLQILLDLFELLSQPQSFAHVDVRLPVHVRLERDGVITAHTRQLSADRVVRTPEDPIKDALGRRLLTRAQPFQHLEQRCLDDGVDLRGLLEEPSDPLTGSSAEHTDRILIVDEEAAVIEVGRHHAMLPDCLEEHAEIVIRGMGMINANESTGLGQYIRGLRKVRGWTQQDLAARSGLASETIRRLEKEEFSPSLRTLQRVVAAFGIRLSALFSAFDLDDDPTIAKMLGLLAGRPIADIEAVIRLVRVFLRELDVYRARRS